MLNQKVKMLPTAPTINHKESLGSKSESRRVLPVIG